MDLIITGIRWRQAATLQGALRAHHITGRSLIVGNTIGGLAAERAADYTSKRDVVLSPLAGLVILIDHQSWGCAPRCGASPQAIAPSAPPARKKQKVNGIGRLAGLYAAGTAALPGAITCGHPLSG